MKTKITHTLKNTQSTDTQAVKCNSFTNKDLQKQALETMTKATHTQKALTNEEMVKGIKRIASELIALTNGEQAKKLMYANKSYCEDAVLNSECPKETANDLIITTQY